VTLSDRLHAGFGAVPLIEKPRAGRVNLIGEHTDYIRALPCDGESFGTRVAFAPKTGADLRSRRSISAKAITSRRLAVTPYAGGGWAQLCARGR